MKIGACWAKRFFSSIQYNTGVLQRKLHAVPGEYGVILTYHRILPEKFVTRCIEAGMYVTPATFEAHVKYLKNNFDIIQIKGLQSKLANNYRDNQKSRPYCIITIDDGWADFYTYAYPILKRHKVPCVVFLPTSFIGSEKIFWTDQLARILSSMVLKNKPLPMEKSLAGKILALSGSLEHKLDRSISLLKSCHLDEIESVLEHLAGLVGSKGQLAKTKSFLTWDEVRTMTETDIISFGSHTVNHAILTNLNHKEIDFELHASRDRLISEGAVDPSFVPFCYPNGNFNQDIVRRVRDAGYNLSVTTKFGWNVKGSDCFTLKRVNLHQDISSTVPLLLYRLLSCLH